MSDYPKEHPLHSNQQKGLRENVLEPDCRECVSETENVLHLEGG